MNWIKRHLIVFILGILIFIICSAICICFFYGLETHYTVFGENKIELAETGQVGDFIGGVIGTLVSFIAMIVVLITFTDQKDSNKKDKIESRFFNLIQIHLQNVSDMEYNNPYSEKTFKNTKQKR